MFTEQEMQIANATSRSRGAVGMNAIVPRHVRGYLNNYCQKEKTMILDFGAGKEAIHAQALLHEGWMVTAYEFGKNVDPRYHNELALMQEYDIVYASNVLNVQVNFAMARKTIDLIHSVLKEDGIFFANYPASPRKSDITTGEMVQLLSEKFSRIVRIDGSRHAPLWTCYK